MEWVHFEHQLSQGELITSEVAEYCYADDVPDFVEENGYIPIECRECYKALIFWDYSRENELNFMRMLEELPASINGKYNEGVIVFYFRAKEKMLNFLNILRDKMNEFGVDGRIQWRVSGRYWQDDYPQFFKSTKEMMPVKVDNEISITQWLKPK